ncbi:BREX system P-loop protein BrxC [Lachnoanaerobaculum gingivalis]|uniref:BREX system P-loop protein BrxC n=1 Tax=Lachnoanaerobaculum gingivalis TaxID=2490855 RepID=UPI0028D002E8|nr:BREX system P-loop protein BrxC [Lachnoanaerobaculum gingivalis]
MQIKDMFAKKIDREIQGVIIVGQGEETNVSQELEEYVVTKELQKHFADFFNAYKKSIDGTTPKMGVWISGFFGSGKSHFLKILSYLLDNKLVGDKHAIDYFIDDKKITDNKVLSDMQLAADIPADVVLFNIDSKSESNGKQNKDAIVNVFLKVFNEMQGFCSSMPHIADLERRLVEVGRFDEFKEAFEDEYGDPWEESRKDFDFIQDSVVDTLVNMDYMSEAAARNWCEKAIETYTISIEDFAKRVKSYIDSKGENHHVVFLVDEIGQYIGDDSKLMLNLQTVTEELGKECLGRAWVIVTSQQDIDSITKVKGNDFSKIQGRFDTRLSLSSANVDAVIKKRILDKTDTAAQTLRLLYEQKATIIKNLIVFNDSAEKKLYADENDFTESYPFVPYQFNLLASVLTSIRTHGASGKHLSEGERSMLALFKESASTLKDKEMGVIVPFHRFYDALENFLDHSHKGVISKAYGNSYINPDQKDSDVFAINVLKTLFMIKYVMEIESNIDNITSLMIENIDDDRIELKGKVEEAIKILMRQMLVQKNGNLYVFLTDEEQEINNEIEKENVEMSEVITKISEMIFEDIFTEKKYRYPEFGGRYSFSFNQIVDDRPYKSNQTCDIGLRILTPWYDGGMDDATLRMMSGQGREVLVVLPNDDEFLTEMRAYLKIERFIRKNTSLKLAKYESIKETKNVEMRERNANAKLYLTEGLKEATVYVNGDIVRLSAKEVNSKVNEALGRLVKTVFHKLSYIDTAMGEADIRKLLHSTNQLQMLPEGGTIANTHALDDVQGYIAMNSRNHMKTSMKSVKDRFMKAPYGFVEDDINWLVACLFKRGDLAFNVNGISVNLNNKSEDDIISYITKKAFVEKLLMEERVRVSEKDKKAVRDVMKEVFNTTVTTEDEDSIMNDFQRSSSNMINEMDKLEVYYKQYDYPGKNVIDTGKRLLKSVIQISGALEFFSYVSKYRETFFDMAEDYEPVKTFFNGEQQNIFKRSLDMLAIYDDSKTYIVDRELEEVIEKMRSILKQDKPYKNIPQLPELRYKFMERYSNILEEQSEPVKDSIKQDRSRVLEVLNTKSYKDEKLARYTKAFDELLDGAEQCNNISTLRSFADKADALKLRLLNEMTEEDNRIAQEVAKRLKLEQEKRKEEAGRRGEEVKAETFIEDVKQEFKVRTTKNISIKTVAKTASWRLESSEDIEKYLAILRENLLKEIKEDTIINIEL